MLAQPRFEAGDQLRFDWRGCCGDGLANADLDDMSAKEPCAVHGVVIAAASLRAWASTGAQMPAEYLKIDLAQQYASRRQDVAEMRRRPQIPNSSVGAIALAFERRCKAVEIRTAWPAAQMPQHLRC